MLKLSELKLGLRITLTTKETSPYQNRWRENCPSSPDLNNQTTDTKSTRYKMINCIPNKEAPVKKQQTSHRKGIETDDISSAKLGPDKKNN